jgi:hypothetical protein
MERTGSQELIQAAPLPKVLKPVPLPVPVQERGEETTAELSSLLRAKLPRERQGGVWRRLAPQALFHQVGLPRCQVKLALPQPVTVAHGRT